MHILLTDILTCPRCGPGFGLILLADRMRDREVVEGRLGCSNCRASYVIQDGVAELLQPGEEAGAVVEEAAAGEGAGETAYRVAALLGVGDAPAPVLLVGFSATVAAEVATLLPEARVCATAGPAEAIGDQGGPAWLRHGERLPFRSGSQRGAALGPAASPALVEEAARVVQPGGRLVLDPAPDGAADRVTGLGLELLLE
jgi:uncharacterized protein YbaR (Trm112 family)